MTVKELILSAKRIYFAGYCSCGCGEKLYDLCVDGNKVYEPISERLIKKVRPTLLENTKYYCDYDGVEVEE